MTPRAKELLDMLRARAASGSGDEILPRIRERVIVEKFDHERSATPVLVETVEMVMENGVMVDHTVTVHVPPVDGA